MHTFRVNGELEIKVQTYSLAVRACGPADYALEPQEIHDFIMEALTEGRIDLVKANLFLGQCFNPGEAREL